ncbi:MAG: hypothetical protein L0Z50_22490 [Verrucomicrobiales bacterium]|nr:hypothetical protein [Verrucomicrobiales bacterium]
MKFMSLKSRCLWFVAFALSSLLFVAGCASRHSRNSDGASNGLAERVTFYAVPLRCPAAPEIGCGSKAKPLLRELERASAIDEAWLNRAGTQIAIVWAEGGSSKARRNAVEGILKKQKLAATELSNDARPRARSEFQSGGGWHRADAVDRLSEEEAGIIAARLVRRVQAKAPLSETNAETLRKAATDTLKKRFLGSPEEPSRTPEQEQEAFLKAAANYLNATELTALREAIASGLRPLPGEQ